MSKKAKVCELRQGDEDVQRRLHPHMLLTKRIEQEFDLCIECWRTLADQV